MENVPFKLPFVFLIISFDILGKQSYLQKIIKRLLPYLHFYKK